MLAEFNMNNDQKLDNLMEETQTDLDPLTSMGEYNMDDIFQDTMSFMPEMESEMVSF